MQENNDYVPGTARAKLEEARNQHLEPILAIAEHSQRLLKGEATTRRGLVFGGLGILAALVGSKLFEVGFGANSNKEMLIKLGLTEETYNRIDPNSGVKIGEIIINQLKLGDRMESYSDAAGNRLSRDSWLEYVIENSNARTRELQTKTTQQ